VFGGRRGDADSTRLAARVNLMALPIGLWHLAQATRVAIERIENLGRT